MNRSEDWGQLRIGEDNRELRLERSQDHVAVAAAFAAQARRGLDVVSRQLDRRVYDTSKFVENARAFAVSGRNARMRLLILDTDALIKKGHRLLDLARRLTSFMEIRRLEDDFKDFNEAFLIADGVAYLYQNLADRYDGAANFHDPLRSRALLRVFDDMWEHSPPASELRSLHI